MTPRVMQPNRKCDNARCVTLTCQRRRYTTAFSVWKGVPVTSKSIHICIKRNSACMWRVKAICFKGYEEWIVQDQTDVLYSLPLDLALSTPELLNLYLPFGCTEGCFLWDDDASYCAVFMWSLWMSTCPCIISVMCAATMPNIYARTTWWEAWRQSTAWYVCTTCWYDYSTGCSPSFRPVINNLFEDFVNRCQDNKKQHRCSLHALPPSTTTTTIYVPFFPLINMEMSRSLLLVGKKAVMSLVTDSMDVFGLQGSLFSESVSYLCLGSESKM